MGGPRGSNGNALPKATPGGVRVSGRVGFACPTSDRCHAGIVAMHVLPISSCSQETWKGARQAASTHRQKCESHYHYDVTASIKSILPKSPRYPGYPGYSRPPAPVVTGCTLFLDLLYIVWPSSPDPFLQVSTSPRRTTVGPGKPPSFINLQQRNSDNPTHTPRRPLRLCLGLVAGV